MMLRACLIGAGVMGKNHGRVLHEVSGVELVSIVDPEGDPYGIARGANVYQELAPALEQGVDFAIVAVPTRFHEEVGLQLASAGVHALIEKPLAATSISSSKLAKAFEDAGLVGAVGHIERFNPAIRQLRARLSNGDLGQVFQISTRRLSSYPNRISDVGVTMDLASHDIDLTSWVTDSAYESVYALAASRTERDTEDLISINAELSGNVVANHLVNWLSPLKERVTMVTGEAGAFIANTTTGDLTFYKNGSHLMEWESVASFRGVSEGDVTRFAYPKREPLRLEIECFRDAILGEGSDICTLHEGLQVVQVVEACLDSSRSNTVVRLGSEV